MPLGSSPVGAAPLGAIYSEQLGHVAQGFSSTSFGSPTASYSQFGSSTAIAPATTFGLPVADFATRYIVSGVAPSATFGTPFSIYPQIGATVGFRRWTFGTPTRAIFNYAPSASHGTRFGQPVANSLDWSAPTNGVNSTRFGTPVRGGGIACQVVGISPGVFGAPSAKYPQFGVTGIQPHTIFGTPRFPLDASLDTVFVFQKTNRVDVWSEL